MYSPDGLITEDGFKSMLAMLKTLEPTEFGNVEMTFAQTFLRPFRQGCQRLTEKPNGAGVHFI